MLEWASEMLVGRRQLRYPVNLRLRLQLPSGELETSTEEVSLLGFSAQCAQLPTEGEAYGFTLHLPDGEKVSGRAAAVRLSSNGLAGFSCEMEVADQGRWSAFLEQEHGQGGVWRLLSRWVGGAPSEEVRSVKEARPSGVVRLHMVGENGEAYRIAFEKHQSQTPAESTLARASPRVFDFAQKTISRILLAEVELKPAPHAPVQSVRLVEMVNGAFGFLVEHPGGKPGVIGLHGSELMVVEVDGRPVFPFFTDEELERISADTFRRETASEGRAAAAGPQVREERFASEYSHQRVDTQTLLPVSLDELRDVVTRSPRRQTRSYGARTLHLIPDVWLELRRSGAQTEPLRGFAMEDGERLCVFVLVGKGAPKVVAIEANDQVFNIRGGP